MGKMGCAYLRIIPKACSPSTSVPQPLARLSRDDSTRKSKIGPSLCTSEGSCRE